MKNFDNFCLFLLTALLLSSCSVHKNLNSSEKMLAVKTETKSVAEQFKQSKTVTDIKESVDTSVMSPPSNVAFDVDVKDTNPQIIETDGLTVTYQSDPKTGKAKINATAKSQKVPVKFNRNTHTESTVDQTTKSTTEVKQAVKSKEKESVKIVEKTGLSFPWWVWLIIVLLILAVIGRGCYILYKRVKASGWV